MSMHSSTSLLLMLQAPLAASMTVVAPIAAIDAARLYGRFAEKQLYLDKNVGACCHSACSDCEWRDPGGGYRFDLLKANFPKWLPCYLERDFCDERGCHVPTWSQALFPDGPGSTISKSDFSERFVALDFEMPMGPKGTVKPDNAEPSPESVEALWAWLCGGEAADELEATQALSRLQDMSATDEKLDPERAGSIGEGPDFVSWKDFAKALGAAPFDRW